MEKLALTLMKTTIHIKTSQRKHVPHTATYIKEKDLYYGPHKDRTAPNSISVLKSPGNPDIRIYRLIYEGGISGCFVFRVPGQHDGGSPSDVAADGVSQLKSRVQFFTCGKWAESAMALMKRWLSSSALQENWAGDREVSRKVREASKNTGRDVWFFSIMKL
ncbi:uncharacterized protein [Dermacentor andersoni]|uniref:uncharacterized protein isoform X3 n=1 Tax=Dermacentor andersoni TaxID=34620 RepID=UPI003B3A0FB4